MTDPGIAGKDNVDVGLRGAHATMRWQSMVSTTWIVRAESRGLLMKAGKSAISPVRRFALPQQKCPGVRLAPAAVEFREHSFAGKDWKTEATCDHALSLNGLRAMSSSVVANTTKQGEEAFSMRTSAVPEATLR